MSSQEMDVAEFLCRNLRDLGISYEEFMQEALELLYNGEGEAREEEEEDDEDDSDCWKK
jgi:hypothetical protein